MTQLDHYQKIRSQPYKAHELWQQTLTGQALKRVDNLPENLPDQLALNPLERILYELLKLPRTFETLTACEVLPPKDCVAYLHALVSSGCLKRQGSQGAKHILPLEIRKLKAKFGIAAPKATPAGGPRGRPVARQRRVAARPGGGPGRPPPPPPRKDRPKAPRPGFSHAGNPISFSSEEFQPSADAPRAQRAPRPNTSSPSSNATMARPGTPAMPPRPAPSRPPPTAAAATPNAAPPGEMSEEASRGMAPFNPYKVDTAQDAELQAWADNNLASDLAKKIESKHEGMAEQTHYQFLEIDERASSMEIRAAYQSMGRVFTPKALSKAGINDMDLQYKAGTIFSRLKLVQQILTDAGKRAEYDQSLQAKAFSNTEGPTTTSEKVSMHKLKADDYLKKGQFHLAEEHYRAAVAENPKDAPLKTAYAWSIAMNTKRDDAERVGSATEILKEVIQEFRHAEAAYKLGLMAQGSGNSKAALRFFDLALSMDANHPGAKRQKEMWEGAAKRAAQRKAAQAAPKKGGMSGFLGKLKSS